MLRTLQKGVENPIAPGIPVAPYLDAPGTKTVGELNGSVLDLGTVPVSL
jgi:hypothetical protein